MTRGSGPTQRRRLVRALDELTVRWATNTLPATCRWLLNTQVLFLRKSREPTAKQFDDEEWLREMRNSEWFQDVAEEEVDAYGEELEADGDVPMEADGGTEGQRRDVKVRPIQIGEFLRRWVSRRLLALSRGDTSRVMLAMRQLGVGMPGGAEALATFHQLLHEVWANDELDVVLARVKVDESNCYGSLEWPAIRKATAAALPRHLPVLCWKHAAASEAEQPNVPAAAKDRGAEQGDVDGSVECSLTLGNVATKTRHSIHTRQRQGALPWLSASPDAGAMAVAEFDDREARAATWDALEPEHRRASEGSKAVIPDPRHELQGLGGIVDYWYIDDGDVLIDARLVPEYLETFDHFNPEVGAARNRLKTEVIYYTSAEVMRDREAAWRLADVRALATVRTADEPGFTLGVAVGPHEAIEAQLRQKVDVVRAMQERVAIVHDVQTEHVLNRECLGVGRVNHILRVHGHDLLRPGGALEDFDARTRVEMDRLFPGLAAESHAQAALGPAVGGLGWRRATEIARPANLGALIMAEPKVRSMAASAAHAGLLRAGQLEGRLAAKIRRVEMAYLEGLDEVDRVQAADLLRQAKAAAAEHWSRLASGDSTAARAPVAPAAQFGDDEPSTARASEDEASPERSRRMTPQHLQRELSKLADRTRLRALEAVLRQQCNWEQLEALRDLRHPEMSHKWLWHLDSRRGSVVAPCDYVCSVQRRLGARMYEREAQCRLCGSPLDPGLVHADCCDPAGATRGHYAVVRALVRGLKLADPTTTTEPRGLTTTQSRPADILTNAAVPGRSAALDVCVAAPSASRAAGDAAEAAFRRKLRRYRREIPQLAAAGIVFRPMVWTANGRPHPVVTRTLAFAAEVAANRSERDVEPGALLSRWRHELQVAILRRRAAMMRAVLPRVSADDTWLLVGLSGAVPRIDGRAAPLTVDEELRQTDSEEDDGGDDGDDGEEMGEAE